MAIPEKGRKKKKKYRSPGSPHKKETKENIKKALEVGKLKKKVKKQTKKAKEDIKKGIKELYTKPLKTTGKKIWEEAKKSIKFPKTKKIGKELVSLSPKDYVEGTKTAARAVGSMIPGREEAYLKRSKGGPVDARKIAKKYFKGTF